MNWNQVTVSYPLRYSLSPRIAMAQSGFYSCDLQLKSLRNINWLIATLIYTFGYIRRKVNRPSTYYDMGKTGATNPHERGIDSFSLDDCTGDYVSSS